MKTAVFGVPCGAPEPETCRICGCSEERVGGYVGWADETRTLCDNPACVAAARAELTAKPEEAGALERGYDGPRFGFADSDVLNQSGLLDGNAKHALEQLQAKLAIAVQSAHEQGLDFVHGPLSIDQPDPFSAFDITRPVRLTATVKGGPVEPGQDWPRDWTVYRCPPATEQGCRACGQDLANPSASGAEDGLCGECIDDEPRLSQSDVDLGRGLEP